MHSLHILLPVAGKESTYFDPSKIEKMQPYPLQALNPYGMELLFFETTSSRDQKNEVATKMLRYLLSPAIVYQDVDIAGDVLLRVQSGEKRTVKEVLDLIQQIYDAKDSGKIPSFLKEWIEERIRQTEAEVARLEAGEQTTKVKSQLKLLRSNISYLHVCISDYGQKKSHQEMFASKLSE